MIFGDRASVWFGAVARGDNEPIRIGAGLQRAGRRGAACRPPGYPLTLGENVSVGHQAMLHGCTVGAGALVGIQAVVLNGAVIGAESLVGAGALVTERKEFPPRSMILKCTWLWSCAQLSDEEVAGLRRIADNYARRSAQYRDELQALD